MMAGVEATYWAVIGADKRADNSPNWTFVLMLCGFIDCGAVGVFVNRF